MAIEQAGVDVVRKPWGSMDLRPWSDVHANGQPVGELWYRRADTIAPQPALLLKLLFVKEPLSIQVHPDDVFARSIGLARGKTEAWYIVSADAGAEVAIGLKRHLTAPQLRIAIEDGSIADLVQWRRARKGDVFFVPAGVIHAIGPGLVIAEIQQRSDATFRLFDHGRGRELHVDYAVAMANASPADDQPAPTRLSNARILLIANPYFVFERVDLEPNSHWELRSEREAWLLAIDGDADFGPTTVLAGAALFLESDSASIKPGANGFKGLLAYVGPDVIPSLLRNLDAPSPDSTIQELSRPPPRRQPTAGSIHRTTKTRP